MSPRRPANTTTQPQTEKPKRWVVVETPPVIDGTELRNATASPDRAAASMIIRFRFRLKPSGADKFGKWTGANINEYMGIVLNDEVKSAPYIKSQIFDQGEITGKFTQAIGRRSRADAEIRRVAGGNRISGRAHGRARASALTQFVRA